MDVLAILFPQVRTQVLRLLFADASAELHLRDLARRSGLALGTIQTELAKLTAAHLVVSERDGNRRYYRANAAHPLFPTLQQLVLQTTPGKRSAATPSFPAGAHPPPAPDTTPDAAALTLHSVTLNEID